MYGLLMVDIASTTLDEADIALLKQPQVGGIILFARNIESPSQVRALCDSIRRHSPDILIGVDQEGGRVARLREGFTPIPAMGQLGQYFEHHPVDALSLAYDCGYLMASEVMAVGIDISFAPVLDLNGVSQVIGDRSFHANAAVVTTLATQFMRGVHDAGMATTGKHFPGHGSLAPDTHLDDAIDSRYYADIEAQDMQPFIQTLPWLDALMPAHVIFDKVDSKPAGYSKIWLQDILRHKLKFDGVIFSDDLSMQAAKVAGDIGDRINASIQAGCDMALVCNDRSAALQAVDVARHLPKPNQKRLAVMSSTIPTWQDNLTQTCQQFAHWQQARSHILDAFYQDACYQDALNTDTLNTDTLNKNEQNTTKTCGNDPTNYQRFKSLK